jgi:hypothetical protein
LWRNYQIPEVHSANPNDPNQELELVSWTGPHILEVESYFLVIKDNDEPELVWLSAPRDSSKNEKIIEKGFKALNKWSNAAPCAGGPVVPAENER